MATELGPGTRVTPSVRLLQPIGSGGMGSVWLAEHTGLGAEVAVKLIRPEQLSRSRSATRFAREASLAARIRSPHVVRVFDHGTMPDETPYIVMEVLHGESLADRLAREERLPPRLVSLLVTQTAEALRAAHRLGVVHRDIKPGNLFLEESSYELFVKVLDFGIAKDTELVGADSLTETGGIMGTPYYMSPEQLLTPKGVDARADLWGLSVVAYHALTGELPFRGATVAALAVAIREGPPRPPSSLVPGLPDELDVWFRLALHRDISLRFPDAATLADGFDRACRGRPSLVSTTDPPTAALVSPARRSSSTTLEPAGRRPRPQASTAATRPAKPDRSLVRAGHANDDTPRRAGGGPMEAEEAGAVASAEPPATQSCRMAAAADDEGDIEGAEGLALDQPSDERLDSTTDAGGDATLTGHGVPPSDRRVPLDDTLEVGSGRHAAAALSSPAAGDEAAGPTSRVTPEDHGERHAPSLTRRALALAALLVAVAAAGSLVAYSSVRMASPASGSTASAIEAGSAAQGTPPETPSAGATTLHHDLPDRAPATASSSTHRDPHEPSATLASGVGSAAPTARAAREGTARGGAPSAAARGATPPSTGAAPTGAPSTPDCSVPFVVDEHGDLHPRRECLR